ncbi:MAG: hypothetical protein ACREU0_04290 [Burkholderiales bacterium]
MAVDLGAKFGPEFEGIPPHVSSEDLLLWEVFRKRYAKDYVGLYFDVALGSGEEAAENVRKEVADAWQRLTRFRADVVGDTGAEWHLIELRPNAGPGAVGAVQTYTTLWSIAPPDPRPVRAILVTDRCARDIQTVARLAGIEVRCLSEPA